MQSTPDEVLIGRIANGDRLAMQVERVTVAMVAPLGPHSRASTRACFEFARPLG